MLQFLLYKTLRNQHLKCKSPKKWGKDMIEKILLNNYKKVFQFSSVTQPCLTL